MVPHFPYTPREVSRVLGGKDPESRPQGMPSIYAQCTSLAEKREGAPRCPTLLAKILRDPRPLVRPT